MVLTDGIRVGVAAMVVILTACGSSSVVHTPPPTAGSTPAPRSSAAAGACASVTTTTPIEQVPAACAALWAPYGVTKVPPANLTDSTPVPPSVVNATGGAISDADAAAWALAVNRTGEWLRWSEAYGQYQLTNHIESSQVVNAAIDQAMRQGMSVIDPECDLFAQKYVLYPMTAAGHTFFSSFGQVTHDQFVFVESYPAPCAILERNGTGPPQTLLSTQLAVVSVSAGAVRHDAVLGDIWFGDGTAFCTSRGAPTAWCSP